MDVKMSLVDGWTRRSISVASFFIVISLSLNFVSLSGGCPMTRDGGKAGMRACDCCSKCCNMHAHHTVSGKSPGMCHHCELSRMTYCGGGQTHLYYKALPYLGQHPVVCTPPLIAGPFREYQTNVVVFPFAGKKDRPPEAS
jgi:hypothetical protein